MSFREDASVLIQQKKFDDFEALWMNQIESDPSDVDTFLNAAKALRKAEQRTQSDTRARADERSRARARARHNGAHEHALRMRFSMCRKHFRGWGASSAHV